MGGPMYLAGGRALWTSDGHKRSVRRAGMNFTGGRWSLRPGFAALGGDHGRPSSGPIIYQTVTTGSKFTIWLMF